MSRTLSSNKKIENENITVPVKGIFDLYNKFLFKDFRLDELIFSITDKCQFRCKTCFYADTMEGSTEKSIKGMDIEEIKKISSSIDKINKLLLTGGEPYLRDDLSEICEIFYKQNSVRHIHIPTNAFQTTKVINYTEDALKKCPKMNLTVSVSIDGFEESHYKIRGIKDSFNRCIETTHALSKLKKKYENLNINIITVVNHINLNEIIDFCEFVKNELPVDSHGPVPVRGDPFDPNIRPPTSDQWKKLSKDLVDYQRYWNSKRSESNLKKFIRTNRENYLYKTYTRVMENKDLPSQCLAGEIIGVLESNGDVRVCELKEPIGNVKFFDYDFKKVWFSKVADEMRKTVIGCSCTHPCFIQASNKANLKTLIASSFIPA